MRRKPANAAKVRLMLSTAHLKVRQLQNDLDASRRRFDLLEEANENLRKDHSLQSHALAQAYHERDDWREAFKLIMKLVK